MRDNLKFIYTTYTQALTNLSFLLDAVTRDKVMVIIRRCGEEDVALVSAGEMESLLETVYLLRSPKNAKRLLAALGRALEYGHDD